MESLIRDLRIGLRSLRQRPGFALVAVLTLAIGIGASTAIFAVLEASLLRPLPFREPDRLAMVWGVAGSEKSIRGASPIEIQDWRAATHSFDEMSMYDAVQLNLSGDGDATQVSAERVSPEYFGMLGASALVGRALVAEDDHVGGVGAAVISETLWRTRYGADPRTVGRTIQLDAQPFTIVGVMPKTFGGVGFNTDVWTPISPFLSAEALTARGNRWLGVVARIKPGVTEEAAQKDLDAATARLAQQYPDYNKERGAQLIPLRQALLANLRGIILILFGGVGLLLLIACANVANLQLVRTSSRLRELSLRHALGASRARIVRQLFTESVLLTMIGAMAGVITAAAALSFLLPLIPAGLLPGYATVSLNPLVVAFAFVVAVVSGALLGVLPALTNGATSAAAMTGARTTAAGWRRGRVSLQQCIVGGEVALSLVLLAAAGLALRSFRAQLAIDPGFSHQNVLGASVNLSGDRYDRPGRTLFTDRLLAELRADPNVADVAIASDAPLRNTGSSAARLQREDHPDDAIRYYRHRVTPTYFTLLDIPLVDGRTFTEQDREGTPGVVVVSATFARKLWPGEKAVGRKLLIGKEWLPVVGVVGDVHYRDLTTNLMDPTNDPDLYVSFAQASASGPVDILIRTKGNVSNATSAVRDIVRRMDSSLALYGTAPLTTTLAQQTGLGRLTSWLLALFGVLSLVLAAIGLYGVMSFIVRGRRREIAIRSAIGASPSEIRSLVLGQGMKVVVAGLAIGTVGAFLAGRVLAGMLFGVSAKDPVVFAVTASALLAAALFANWLPAREAMRVAPQTAMIGD